MIRKRSDGNIAFFTSDGYEGYREAILSAYGEIQNNVTAPSDNLCYAQVNKKIERKSQGFSNQKNKVNPRTERTKKKSRISFCSFSINI